MSPSARARKSPTRRRNERQRAAVVTDPHVLYEAAVQSPDVDVDFLRRLFRRRRGREARSLREDFCGTGAVSCAFARARRGNRAYGVDLDASTLAWGEREHRARLGERAENVRLLRGDVRTTRTPKVDILCACNFSYWVFHERAELLGYLRAARRRLKPDGLLLLDTFGGTLAQDADVERRRVTGGIAPDGSRIPSFVYEWEQQAANIVDNRIVCRIHFELSHGRRLRNAFSYDWRMWTVPELRDLMHEAGFAQTEVYTEGWDDDLDETDGIFRRRTFMANQLGWVAYVVGL